MYKDVVDEGPACDDASPPPKQKRETENEILLRGLTSDESFNPNASASAEALGRLPRIKRAPSIQPATAETVADKELFE